MLSLKDLWFINDELWRLCICDAYNAVIKCNLYDFVKDNEIQSFMYFSHDNNEIQEKFKKLSHLADIKNLHSGASYACTMREVERMIKKGFLEWKYDYIKDHHIFVINKITYIQKLYKKVISNPNYKLCRNRLNNEYLELKNELSYSPIQVIKH